MAQTGGALHQKWILLDEAINEYLVESEQSNHKYFKLWHLGFGGMMDLGLDAFFIVRSMKLPVASNKTVPLPPDFLQYSKVGVLNGKGEIIPLSVNNKLTVAFDIQNARLEKTQDPNIPTATDQSGIWWYNYWDSGFQGNIYGLPSGTPFIGSFKIDNENGVIILSEDFAYDYVMLEYVSSPTDKGEYYIPVHFKQAIVAYLRWKDIISIPAKTHVQNSNVAMRRKEYFNERRLAIARFDPINLSDLYEQQLQTMRLTVKA